MGRASRRKLEARQARLRAARPEVFDDNVSTLTHTVLGPKDRMNALRDLLARYAHRIRQQNQQILDLTESRNQDGRGIYFAPGQDRSLPGRAE